MALVAIRPAKIGSQAGSQLQTLAVLPRPIVGRRLLADLRWGGKSEQKLTGYLIMRDLWLLDMAPYYEALCKSLDWQMDVDLLSKMKKANEEELKRLDEELEDAEKNLGESEIRDAMMAKAEYLCQIGDKVSEMPCPLWVGDRVSEMPCPLWVGDRVSEMPCPLCR